MSSEQLQVLNNLAEVDAQQWNRLAGDNPFLRYEFLRNLERSGCVSIETGWAPKHLTLHRDGELVAAMPLYLKTHSYGEYIFDWAWADAYHRHGLRYYPKLVSAVPFTPVTGMRLLTNEPALQHRLCVEALRLAQDSGASSLHVLFLPEDQAAQLKSATFLSRDSVQFHWHNQDYENFGGFLAEMSHDKRKKIKQERRKLHDHGVCFEWLEGNDISEADWLFFGRCYRATYREHQSTPYLNLDFFLSIGRDMPEHLVLVKAWIADQPVAVALNFKNGDRLFGRHWGSVGYIPGLHFETCYYQGIEYCIERKLKIFEGGVQGEHKLARGLLPVKTYSSHWLAHPQFSDAITDYLARESQGIERYVDELNGMSPFKAKQSAK
ncbi:MAG: GNAT family N-acetyltransferase [Burkholderiales bacterium]